MPGGHLQTIAGAVLPRASLEYRRERWTAPDGDFIDVDFAPAPRTPSGSAPPSSAAAAAAADTQAPVLVLFHGLEGNSRSHYALAMMASARAAGFQALVAHFRGCSGEPNRLPRAYHSGDSDEIDWILRRARAIHPRSALYAVGVSLGGNALAKWLGERGSGAGFVSAAASICAPLDLAAGGAALERGFNRVYARMFLATLRRKALAKVAQYPGLAASAAIAAARNLHAFDDAFTAPVHGFRDADDYWARASAGPGLRSVTVPLLLLNPVNDPIVPAASLPRAAAASAAVRLEQPATGGHVGFPRGPWPGNLDYLPRRVLDYFIRGS